MLKVLVGFDADAEGFEWVPELMLNVLNGFNDDAEGFEWVQ